MGLLLRDCAGIALAVIRRSAPSAGNVAEAPDPVKASVLTARSQRLARVVQFPAMTDTPKSDGSNSSPADDVGTETLAPMDFSMFILSLASSAMVNMGKVDSPDGREVDVNLDAAKQLIDILGVLEEKTRGNLSEAESGLLSSLLYDLRVNFVDQQKAAQS